MQQRKTLPLLTFALVALVCSSTVLAQVGERQAKHIFTPMASPGAEVAQDIGLTEVRVSYHRPAAKERDIWGTVVPSSGAIWRTGANENTLISVSTDVTVQGQTLSAGTYGLHTIPGSPATEGDWTIIFSKAIHAWGSYAYDEKNDALRVMAKPTSAPHMERFEISFGELDADSAHLILRWGEVAVPVEIAVDLAKTVKESFEQQLTGLSAFFWEGWDQAAQYSLQNDMNLDSALEWAEKSIGIEENFSNLSAKAQLLAKKGEDAQVAGLMAKAMELGNAGQIHRYASQLLTQGKKEEAMAAFKTNVAKHPDAWFVGFGLAKAYSAIGDFDNAVKAMKMSVDKAPEQRKAFVKGMLEKLENKVDIN